MNALRQTRVLRHWWATSIISARRPIAASTTSIKLNLFEHQLSNTKPSVRCMTTASCSKCLKQARQMNAKAIQSYKDELDTIMQKREETRIGRDYVLASHLAGLLLECKSQMRQIIEKAQRETAENSPPDPAKSENLKTRLDDIKKKIWHLLGELECSRHLYCACEDDEDDPELFFERTGKVDYPDDEEVVDMISAIEERLNELHEDVVEVLDEISYVEDDLEDAWRKAVLLMKDRSLDDPTDRIL